MCLEGPGVHGSECVGAATGVNTSWLRSVGVKWECSAVWSDHCETVPSNRDCLLGITTTVLETSLSRRARGFSVLAASINDNEFILRAVKHICRWTNKNCPLCRFSKCFYLFLLIVFFLQCIAALFCKCAKFNILNFTNSKHTINKKWSPQWTHQQKHDK